MNLLAFQEFIYGRIVLFENQNEIEQFKTSMIENNLEYVILLSDYLKIFELNKIFNWNYDPFKINGKTILNELRLLKNLKKL